MVTFRTALVASLAAYAHGTSSNSLRAQVQQQLSASSEPAYKENDNFPHEQMPGYPNFNYYAIQCTNATSNDGNCQADSKTSMIVKMDWYPFTTYASNGKITTRRCQQPCTVKSTAEAIAGYYCRQKDGRPMQNGDTEIDVPGYLVGNTCVPCRRMGATDEDMKVLGQCGNKEKQFFVNFDNGNNWQPTWLNNEMEMFQKSWNAGEPQSKLKLTPQNDES